MSCWFLIIKHNDHLLHSIKSNGLFIDLHLFARLLVRAEYCWRLEFLFSSLSPKKESFKESHLQGHFYKKLFCYSKEKFIINEDVDLCSKISVLFQESKKESQSISNKRSFQVLCTKQLKMNLAFSYFIWKEI